VIKLFHRNYLGAKTMQNITKSQTSQTEKQNEYTTRTTWSHGKQVVVVEQKQAPKFYGAIEI
jgi:hypothetical protein